VNETSTTEPIITDPPYTDPPVPLNQTTKNPMNLSVTTLPDSAYLLSDFRLVCPKTVLKVNESMTCRLIVKSNERTNVTILLDDFLTPTESRNYIGFLYVYFY
jgi:hypothetical protein